MEKARKPYKARKANEDNEREREITLEYFQLLWFLAIEDREAAYQLIEERRKYLDRNIGA